MSGYGGVVRSLCEAGADPNHQGGKKQWSPMHYAAIRSRLDALEIMLGSLRLPLPQQIQNHRVYIFSFQLFAFVCSEFGADPSLKDEQGNTALDLVTRRHEEVMAELNRLSPVKKLLTEMSDLGEAADTTVDDKEL